MSCAELDEFKAVLIAFCSYFTHFEGRQDCDIASQEIYVPPLPKPKEELKPNAFCRNRATLLEALSGGGRHGFDAPFSPKGESQI